MAWQKNSAGRQPRETAGKRVIVRLRNGLVYGAEAVSATAPRGWDAGSTRWSLTGHSHDVVEYEVC